MGVKVNNADMWRVYELAYSKNLPRKLTPHLDYAFAGMIYWASWE